jgi:GT2 family glycosyltransferase
VNKRISFIIATIGRVDLLRRLLVSLQLEARPEDEIIIVDQNQDNRICGILEMISGRINIRHLKCAPGLSGARNLGLFVSTGDIVCFPDDDCWYPQGTVTQVINRFSFFDQHILTGKWIDPEYKDRDRWPKAETTVSKANVFACASSITIFCSRLAIVDAGATFDQKIGAGAGTVWGSGEETDFLLQLLAANKKITYLPNLCIYHPYDNSSLNLKRYKKAIYYSAGWAYVAKKHSFGIVYLWSRCAKTMFGALLAFGLFRPKIGLLHLASFIGRVLGLLKPIGKAR